MTTLDGECGFPAQRIIPLTRVGAWSASKYPAANVPPRSGLADDTALIGFGSVSSAFSPVVATNTRENNYS